MTNEIEVQPANLSQIDILAELFNAYRHSYGQPADLTGAKAFLSDRLKAGESTVYLANCDSQPAGFTQLYPSFSSISLRNIWILNDLFVAPEFRGRGVGSRLLDAARELAEQTDAKGLTLETDRKNHVAQRLYERKGWQRDDVFFRYELRTWQN